MIVRLLGLLFCLAGPAAADVGSVHTEGPLDDAAFYRLVTCGAPPGRACAGPLIRWPASRRDNITVSLYRTDPATPPATLNALNDALSAAIGQINAAGADIRLRQAATGAEADIRIFLTATAEGETLGGIGRSPPDGDRMAEGLVYLWWSQNLDIEEAIIIYSARMKPEAMRSVVLEEIAQALGFLYDIDNDSYAATSIFAENGDSVTRISGQDAIALRRHYPPGE